MSIRELNHMELESVSGGLGFYKKLWDFIGNTLTALEVASIANDAAEALAEDTPNATVGSPLGSSTGPGISFNSYPSSSSSSSSYSNYTPGTYQPYEPPETSVESEEWVEND